MNTTMTCGRCGADLSNALGQHVCPFPTVNPGGAYGVPATWNGYNAAPVVEQPTLRDRFAMAALGGMLADPTGPGRFDDEDVIVLSASVAYRYADAMLAARVTGVK